MLRDVHDDDLAIFFEHQQDAEAVHMAAFTSKDPSDRAAFDAHWAKIRGNPGITIRTILADGDVAGHLASFDMEGDRDVTYWIGRPHWGRGLATEALQAFLQVETQRPLHARVAFDNVGSARVLEKCGFVRCGEGRFFANARGAEIEEHIYRLDARP